MTPLSPKTKTIETEHDRKTVVDKLRHMTLVLVSPVQALILETLVRVQQKRLFNRSLSTTEVKTKSLS
eukprot:6472788-Amphidinium_carterae.3